MRVVVASSVLLKTVNILHKLFLRGVWRLFVGHEQRRGGLHRPEAGVRPVLQPLVRGEVPEGGPERRSVHRELPEVPALRAEGHQGEGHPGGRRRVHGPQQGQARELRLRHADC